jgi:hypothetical protein
MSCPHAESTALLAVFGEAPAEFETHLNSCAECLEIVQSHTQTLSIVEPTLQRTQAPTEPRNKNNSRWFPATVLVLLAATLLLAIQMATPSSDPGRLVVDSPIHTATIPALSRPFDSSLDSDLDSLEIELAFFSLE